MAFVRLFLLKSNQRPKRLPSPEPAVFLWQFFWRWKITLFWYQQVQVVKTKQTMISGNVRTTTRVYHSEGKPLGIKRSQNKRYDLSFSFKIPPSFDAVNKYTSYKYFGYSIWDEKNRECGPGGGTLGISGWGCAAGTLEPLAYTRVSSAEFCYPILE